MGESESLWVLSMGVMWFNLLKGSVSTLLRRHCKGQGKKQRDYKRLIQVACWGHSTGEDHKRLNSECILEVEPKDFWRTVLEEKKT